ncbi:MAG: ribosome biogenesis GTP-binding protein YihA/YsxC [Patescibacteria group bacterium]
MKINNAEFVKGVVDYQDPILHDRVGQIAFIGRSNVGKSSLINNLTNRKSLVRTSGQPGKTREINFYKINNKFYFVDLPGYGYAKTDKETKENLQNIIFGYLFDEDIDHTLIVVIIDANVGATSFDIDVIDNLRLHEKNFVIVANKIDKINKTKRAGQMHTIRENIGDLRVLEYSTTKNIGKENLLAIIDECLPA